MDPRRSLPARLRAETATAHLAAETSFDLDARLVSLDAYANGLCIMAAFHDACAPLLQSIGAALPPALRDGPTTRRARLRTDLLTLGRAGSLPCEPRSTTVPSIDPDRALGAWYVHEGAALGGLVIAGEIRRRLPAAVPAMSFFAGEGKGTAARWRAFGSVLSTWEGDGRAVVDGALATFATLAELMALRDAA